MIEQGVDVAKSVACGPACAGNPLMRLAALILCLVLAGPVMFLCGVSYLFDTATDTRGSAIKVSAKIAPAHLWHASAPTFAWPRALLGGQTALPLHLPHARPAPSRPTPLLS